MLARLALTVTLLLCGLVHLHAQTQAQFQYSNAQVVGVANDTVFHAYTMKSVMILDYSSGEMTVRLDAGNLIDKDPKVKQIFADLPDRTILFKARPASIFDLYRQENTGRVYPTYGYLTINGKTHKVSASYSVIKVPAAVRNNDATSDNLPLRITLNIVFDPELFELGIPGMLGNPMEMSMTNAIANRVN